MKKICSFLFILVSMSLLQSCSDDVSSSDNSASPPTESSGSSYTYCSGTCKIFITASTYDANLGGAAGADSKCQSDSNKPSGSGLYKALISDSSRHACTSAHCLSGGASEHLDWILKANTLYVRADGTTSIFTTNASAILILTGSHNNLVNTIGTGTSYAWTGIETSGNEWMLSSYTCNNWTTNTSADDGTQGREDVDTYEAFGDNGGSCDQLEKLICVEQ